MSPESLGPAASVGHRTVPISELFYSFQGEGVNCGRRALFVRFMGCNLTCGYAAVPRVTDTPVAGSMLCDTEYTWNGAHHDLTAGTRTLTPPQVWDELTALDPSTSDPALAPVDLVVVSGGEPLLHAKALVTLAAQAAASGRRVEIETNATITPSAELVATGVAFNAGLKLANSAVPRKRRIKPTAIRAIQATGRARWKFVVTGEDDLVEVDALQQEFGLTEIWLSPEGTTSSRVVRSMRTVADTALKRGWNLTTRAHVLIWENTRGK